MDQLDSSLGTPIDAEVRRDIYQTASSHRFIGDIQ